jgi:anaerobic C4-dicarboxylate transporter DcuA
MIAAVVTAAGTLQAAGGMDYLVDLAERALRSYPPAITFVAPLVAYLFTLFAGTGHVAYAILPVIAEVSREAGVRPERPLSISVIASQQAITASPISAATVALAAMLSGAGVTLIGVLGVCIPATLLGVLAGALAASRMGPELKDDPEYQARLAAGKVEGQSSAARPPATWQAKLAVVLFVLGACSIVLFGSFPGLRPSYQVGDKAVQMAMADAIEMVMLGIAALMVVVCKASPEKVAKGSVFSAGMQAVIAIFGVAWMGDTFFKANQATVQGPLQAMVEGAPWTFALALFVLSILLYSQAATVRTLMPLGVTIGLPAFALVGMFPAVNGYFFLPNYPTLVAAINFDRTGTTRIGKWLLNHSFMIPGLVASVVSVAAGLLLARLFLA